MEKLSICRICLASDLRMELIIDTHLQDIFESLTLTSLETKDIRPVQACYVCFARLQNCYLLKMNCLHSEELFTQIIADNQLLTSVNKQELYGTPRLVRTSVVIESFAEETPNDFGFKMEAPDPDSNVQVEMKMLVRDVVLQTDEEGLSDHRESDTNDEIPLDIVKHEIGTIDDVVLQTDEGGLSDNRESDTKGEIPLDIVKHEIGTIDDVTSQADEEDMSDHRNSDPEDEIPLHIVKYEIGTIHDNALPSTSTAEDLLEKRLNNPSQGVSENEKQKTTEAISIKRVYTNNIYKCAQCDKVLKSREILTKHLKAHELSKKYKGMNKNGHTEIQKKTFQCNICKKNCKSAYKLKKHLFLHSSEKPLKCDFCDKSFIEKCDLKTHLTRHKNKGRCICPICKKTFQFKHMLASHIKKTHNANKLFKCETCNKNFKNDEFLNRHRLIHTDENLFKCDICSKLYSNDIDLQRHIRVHSNLKPYECSICKISFSDESYLIHHSRVHSGEKPYECNLCQKTFAYKSAFKIHTYMHSEKPYKCSLCSEVFNVKIDLVNHNKSFGPFS